VRPEDAGGGAGEDPAQALTVRRDRLTARLQELGLGMGEARRVGRELVTDGWVYFGPDRAGAARSSARPPERVVVACPCGCEVCTGEVIGDGFFDDPACQHRGIDCDQAARS
jgi:hypothetical protein